MTQQQNPGAQVARGLGEQAMTRGPRGGRQAGLRLGLGPGKPVQGHAQAVGHLSAVVRPGSGDGLDLMVDVKGHHLTAMLLRPGLDAQQQRKAVAAAGIGHGQGGRRAGPQIPRQDVLSGTAFDRRGLG